MESMEGNGEGERSGWQEKKAGEETLKKGTWTAEEDDILVDFVAKNGAKDWSCIRSKTLLQRSGKSCRQRWVNKLRPGLKSGCKFTEEEKQFVERMQKEIGNKWATIAGLMPGRAENDVKNYWSTRQKKQERLLKQQQQQHQQGHGEGEGSTSTTEDPSSIKFEVENLDSDLEDDVDVAATSTVADPSNIKSDMEYFDFDLDFNLQDWIDLDEFDLELRDVVPQSPPIVPPADPSPSNAGAVDPNCCIINVDDNFEELEDIVPSTDQIHDQYYYGTDQIHKHYCCDHQPEEIMCHQSNEYPTLWSADF